MTEYIRLHISPLNPELLPIILPPTLRSLAANLSYHSLETFPERNYGYLELPVTEAAKLKKKLHGSILKGSKMRVEEARPDKKRKQYTEDDGNQPEDGATRAKKAAKERKREEGVLPGFELPEKRKVRRGWTDPAITKSGKSKEKSVDSKGKTRQKVKATASSFSNQPECLFKTKVPSNRTTEKPRKASIDGKPIKSKKKKVEREVIVHEFTNTTKHASFLRENKVAKGETATSKFDEEKGWINEKGEVIEPVPKRKSLIKSANEIATDRMVLRGAKPPVQSEPQVNETKAEGLPQSTDSDETSSSGISSDEDSEAENITEVDQSNKPSNDHPKILAAKKDDPADEADETSSSGSSSSSDSDDETSNKEDDLPTKNTTPNRPTPTEVHPLEALFKKPRLNLSDSPRKPNLEVKTSFNFFGSDDTNDDSTARLPVPQTPFTQRDLQFRSIRSAAPTPDTAAPNKTGFGFPWGNDDDDDSDGSEDKPQDSKDDDDKQETTPLAVRMASAELEDREPPAESDFAKWFWEHRGETNRAWKKRKREAVKEKRKSDNKRRGRTVAQE